jgi:hypothetical protein
MIHKPPVLQALPHFGNENATRYVIRNIVNQHVWTGHRFSADWRDALLYAHPNEACIDMQVIMRRVYDGQPVRFYEAPCRVEVFGDVSMLDVQRWLSLSAVLKLRTDDYGNGPRKALVIPSIHWAEMERTDEK